MSDDKRSDFPCPSIVRSGGSRNARAVTDAIEAKLEKRTSSAADTRRARNEDYLATKRRNMGKAIRKPR